MLTSLQAYIFGSSFGATNKLDKLRTLAVDYDGAVIGHSLREAYHELEGPQFLGLDWRSSAEYPSPKDVSHAVWSGQYWAAIYANEGATDRLDAAVDNNFTASTYDASRSLTIIYNQARYPDFEDFFVAGDLQQLVQATRLTYNRLNGTGALQSIPASNTASLLAILDPIEATIEDIKPLSNGSTVFYNTVDIVFTILMQFFFLMAFDGMLASWELDSRLPIKNHVIIRICAGLTYTFVGSLCLVANLYAFRDTVTVTGAQFVLLWMAFWLEMHVLFLVLEIAITFLKLPWLPMFIVTFIIMNVTSAVFPFDLSPGFYRWGYALPCHNVYQLEITILSGGADNNVAIALPVLFAWTVVCVPIAYLSLRWRCNKAIRKDKGEDPIFTKGAHDHEHKIRDYTLDTTA